MTEKPESSTERYEVECRLNNPTDVRTKAENLKDDDKPVLVTKVILKPDGLPESLSKDRITFKPKREVEREAESGSLALIETETAVGVKEDDEQLTPFKNIRNALLDGDAVSVTATVGHMTTYVDVSDDGEDADYEEREYMFIPRDILEAINWTRVDD